MESSVPGFIAQNASTHSFKLMKQRYKAATVFVDQYSCLSYVHVHKLTSGDKTIQAKEAFEQYAAQCVVVKHYHADNGIFKSDSWINLCQKQAKANIFILWRGFTSDHTYNLTAIPLGLA